MHATNSALLSCVICLEQHFFTSGTFAKYDKKRPKAQIRHHRASEPMIKRGIPYERFLLARQAPVFYCVGRRQACLAARQWTSYHDKKSGNQVGGLASGVVVLPVRVDKRVLRQSHTSFCLLRPSYSRRMPGRLNSACTFSTTTAQAYRT